MNNRTRVKLKVTGEEIDLSDTENYLKVGLSDLNLYFAGTFLRCGIPEQEDFTWMFIHGFSADSELTKSPDKITVSLIPEKTNRKTLFTLSDLDFDFAFPAVGLYNYKNSAVFFMRRNWRQNKKGLCEETAHCVPVTQFYSPFVSFPASFSMRNLWRWSAANMNQAFLRSEYMGLADAYARVRKYKCLAKALSLNFLLGQGLMGKNPSVWFRKTLIGSALGPNAVKINNPLFYQEAIDFFQPQGVEVLNAK